MASGAVLIVDDHELVRSALAVALAGRGFRVEAIGPAALGPRLAVPAPPGGLLLLDLDLGDGLDGAALVPEVRRRGWRVLVVTGSTDSARIAVAVAAGAAGWVTKTAPLDQLVDHVVRAGEGRSLIADAERARLVALARSARRDERDLDERWSRLTPREREIAVRLGQGMRPTAIAEEFVVALGTVRAQIRAVLGKLEVTSQLEAAAVARRRGGR